MGHLQKARCTAAWLYSLWDDCHLSSASFSFKNGRVVVTVPLTVKQSSSCLKLPTRWYGSNIKPLPVATVWYHSIIVREVKRQDDLSLCQILIALSILPRTVIPSDDILNTKCRYVRHRTFVRVNTLVTTMGQIRGITTRGWNLLGLSFIWDESPHDARIVRVNKHVHVWESHQSRLFKFCLSVLS